MEQNVIEITMQGEPTVPWWEFFYLDVIALGVGGFLMVLLVGKVLLRSVGKK